METSPVPLTRLLREADHYMDINRYEEARKRYLEILSQQPTNGYVHYRLAHCSYRIGEYEEAITHCQTAINHGYAKPMCYVVLGITYRVQKRVALAEEAFREGLEAEPTNPNLMAQLAFLHWQQGNKREARKLIEEAHALGPADQVVLYYKYFMSSRRGRHSEAPELVQQYLQTNATEIQKKLLIAKDLVRAGQFLKARDECREAFVMDPLNHTVLKQLAEMDQLCHPIFWPNRMFILVGRRKIEVVVYVLIVLGIVYNDLYALSLPLTALFVWAKCAPWLYAGFIRLQRGRK